MKAFFGPPVEKIVPAGAHFAAEVIMRKNDRYLILKRPNGLFGSNQNQWFFVHGELLYGEEPEATVRRLVKEQAGIEPDNFRVADLWSWVSDDHWFIVIVFIVEVSANPKPDSGVSEFRFFAPSELPADMAYWKPEDFRGLIAKVS